MNHIIYGIKVNGEYLYIGSTKDLNRRKSQHKNKINNPPKKNKELYEFLKDKEFTYDILHETEDKKERFIKEHELAMKYKSKYNK